MGLSSALLGFSSAFLGVVLRVWALAFKSRPSALRFWAFALKKLCNRRLVERKRGRGRNRLLRHQCAALALCYALCLMNVLCYLRGPGLGQASSRNLSCPIICEFTNGDPIIYEFTKRGPGLGQAGSRNLSCPTIYEFTKRGPDR